MAAYRDPGFLTGRGDHRPPPERRAKVLLSGSGQTWFRAPTTQSRSMHTTYATNCRRRMARHLSALGIASAASLTTRVTMMAAEAVRAFMLSWFLTHNYSPVQADAIIRQANIESRLQPCVRSSMGSWLFGWVGKRRQALARYAGTAGCPGLEMQLAFVDLELRREPYRAFWSAPPQTCFAALRRCFGHGRC